MTPHDIFIYAMLTILSGAVSKLWYDNRRLNGILEDLMHRVGTSETIVEQVGGCNVEGCYLRKHAIESLARRVDARPRKRYRPA